MRRLTSIGLSLVLLYTTYGFACSKASTLTWAQEAVSALHEAGPLLQSVGVPLDKLNVAISAGDRLVAALQDPAAGDPKQLAGLLIHAFEDVVAQTNIIGDANRKTLILAILGIANIALHHIADSIPPAAHTAAGPVVLRFKAQPVWKCRDARSGHYQRMAYCKAHPDTSVVETR